MTHSLLEVGLYKFCRYHGHGNGAQFLSGEKIQRIRVKSVALLFGCSSVTLRSLGPEVEMIGQHYTYLIACRYSFNILQLFQSIYLNFSPCIVGMLWTVTDLDTDVVTTEFLSYWLNSKAPYHWKNINKLLWQTEAGSIMPNLQKQTTKEKIFNEPELLRALCKAKKEATHFITTAACVSRGLPIKIKCKLSHSKLFKMNYIIFFFQISYRNSNKKLYARILVLFRFSCNINIK